MKRCLTIGLAFLTLLALGSRASAQGAADHDGDGVHDQVDLCPDEAETNNQVFDEDGCPDADQDSDRVPDDYDACPREPESVNGFQDRDGCPDEFSAQLRHLAERVYFSTGSDALASGARRVMRPVATLLGAHPELAVVRVEGHADARGGPEANLALSMARARRVAAALIAEGLPSSRVEALGLGALPGTGRALQAENRRVDFFVQAGDESRVQTAPSMLGDLDGAWADPRLGVLRASSEGRGPEILLRDAGSGSGEALLRCYSVRRAGGRLALHCRGVDLEATVVLVRRGAGSVGWLAVGVGAAARSLAWDGPRGCLPGLSACDGRCVLGPCCTFPLGVSEQVVEAPDGFASRPNGPSPLAEVSWLRAYENLAWRDGRMWLGYSTDQQACQRWWGTVSVSFRPGPGGSVQDLRSLCEPVSGASVGSSVAVRGRTAGLCYATHHPGHAGFCGRLGAQPGGWSSTLALDRPVSVQLFPAEEGFAALARRLREDGTAADFELVSFDSAMTPGARWSLAEGTTDTLSSLAQEGGRWWFHRRSEAADEPDRLERIDPGGQPFGSVSLRGIPRRGAFSVGPVFPVPGGVLTTVQTGPDVFLVRVSNDRGLRARRVHVGVGDVRAVLLRQGEGWAVAIDDAVAGVGVLRLDCAGRRLGWTPVAPAGSRLFGAAIDPSGSSLWVVTSTALREEYFSLRAYMVPLPGVGLGTEVTLGLCVSLTGPHAEFGTSVRSGVELAVEAMNDAGGIAARRVRLAEMDDRGDVGETSSAVLRLIDDEHAVAIVGPVSSSLALSAGRICQRRGVPMIAAGATNPAVTQIGDHVFRSLPADPSLGTAMARYAREVLRFTRVCVLVDAASGYSATVAGSFRLAFTSLGGTVVGDESYREGDVSFATQVAAVRRVNPEAVFVPGYYTEVAAIARVLRASGYSGRLLGGDGWQSPTLTANDEDALVGDLFVTSYDPAMSSTPSSQRFLSAFRSRWARDPNGLSATGFDAARMALDAMVRSGSVSPRILREALAATWQLPGAIGPLSVSSEREVLRPMAVMEVREGAFRYHGSASP